jgi:hypothetical protein
MDPLVNRWMFEHWLGDQDDRAELVKNAAYLLASFDHPEEVKSILGDNGENKHISTDEEFEESWEMVKKMNSDKGRPAGRKRNRRVIS